MPLLSEDNRFNGHFPGQPWVSWYQNVSILDFIGAKDEGGGGDNWRGKTNHHHQHTNTQQFYRPDAIPVTQPKVLSLEQYLT